MARLRGASLGMVAVLALAGCGRLGLSDPLASAPPQPQPNYEPLPAAPTQPVTSSALPPPPNTTAPSVVGQPLDPAAPGQPTAPGATPPGAPGAIKPGTVAANDKTPAIGRGEFVGAWRIASGADNCQLFVSLTSGSGG